MNGESNSKNATKFEFIKQTDFVAVVSISTWREIQFSKNCRNVIK